MGQTKEELYALLDKALESGRSFTVSITFEADNTDATIETVLNAIGVCEDLKGYRVSAEAVQLMINEPWRAEEFMRDTLAFVGEKHGLTATCVEHRIRHAFSTAYTKPECSAMQNLVFGSIIRNGKVKPTTKQFIVALANYIRSKS